MDSYLLGLVIKLEQGIEPSFKTVYELGLPTCQISTYVPSFFTSANARQILDLTGKYGISITSLWAGWPGKVVWDFIEGPATVGLVPLATRKERCCIIKRASDFAAEIGVGSVTTHIGFVPESPSDPLYPGLIADLKDIALHCKSKGQFFCFETGQETPVTMLRMIEDIEVDNLGINFDPANLILYGKANPIDALGILGRFVRGVHVKDGRYPTNGRELGTETVLGEGQVNIPLFLSKLNELGYKGALTIEAEIAGMQQEEIQKAKSYLENILKSLIPLSLP
jgi:L-ribulose-5-phosphate 3-epimerase